jgi:CRP-like cAMP-binding protein
VRSGETEKVAVGGELIVRAGDHGAEMYVIQSGRVRITKQMGDREVVLGDLGPGDFFGEMSCSNRCADAGACDRRRSCSCSRGLAAGALAAIRPSP